ncbi:unnamed protein product [Phytomonas sp. EM1]|nr:unnamed protein product [Phytomonas sp. EM1]|eukprot:CCW62660.1 unnamed protein product [Phytomonas sp. isolate EM1]
MILQPSTIYGSIIMKFLGFLLYFAASRLKPPKGSEEEKKLGTGWIRISANRNYIKRKIKFDIKNESYITWLQQYSEKLNECFNKVRYIVFN